MPRALEEAEIPEHIGSYAAAALRAVGADRPGIRLSPGGTFWGVQETKVRELYTALLTELARIGPAYVHLEATAGQDLLLELRRVWPGTLIMNPTLPMDPKQTGRDDADHWLGQGGDRGYLTSPAYQHSA